MEETMSAKEKILDAALTLFAENGYDGTSVEQIARSDRQPQCEKECMEYIEMHLRHFCKVYMR
jgi:hypothetical protein